MQENKLNGGDLENRFDVESSHHFDPHAPEHRDRRSAMSLRYSPTNKLSHRAQHFFKYKPNRWILFTILSAVALIILVFPSLKYGILNSLGFRATVNVTVLDDGTDLPLSEVKVSIGEQSALTDLQGVASVKETKLGKQRITIEKLAYAALDDLLLVKAGTNDLASFEIEPTGVQMKLKIVDWLSGEAIESAVVSSDENAVYSSVSGEALLTIPPTEAEEIAVLVTATDYRGETKTVGLDAKSTTVKLVWSEKHIFVSDENGAYDLYTSDLDGKNQKMLLRATGDENENIQLLVSPTGRQAFMVSTRDGQKNTDGAELYELYLIDTQSGETTLIEESPSIRLYGYTDESLIYTAVDKTALDEDTERDGLYAYPAIEKIKTTLARSNFFNAVMVVPGEVYYAPSEYYKTERMPYLFKVKPSGEAKTVVHAQAVWNIFRSDYTNLIFDAKQDWYSMSLASDTAGPVALSGRPDDLFSRLYEMDDNGDRALWVDFDDDGTGNLMLYDALTATDTKLTSQRNLRYPLRFLGENHVTYRVGSGASARDYVLDMRGGKAAVITEVSGVPGSDRWYYYY